MTAVWFAYFFGFTPTLDIEPEKLKRKQKKSPPIDRRG